MPAASAPSAPRAATRSRSKVLLLAALAAGLVALALVAAAAWWWLTQRRTEEPVAAATPAVAVPAPAVPREPAVLHVAAAPWALATVTASNADALPPTLRVPVPTPFSATLPPGHYVVTLTDPGGVATPQRCELDLEPGKDASCRVVLAEIAPEGYFTEVGWH
jgi:hypothetical protein